MEKLKEDESIVAPKVLEYNGHSKEDMKESVALEQNPFKAAKRLLLTMFSEEELVTRSVSGKAPNRHTPAKPRFAEDKMLVYKDLMRGRFPHLGDKDLVEKVHHVQKGVKKRS